jgi:glucose dehydrogenase
MIVPAFGVIVWISLAPASKAQNASDWPMYNRDLATTRYSPLAQINTTNVANLKMSWRTAENTVTNGSQLGHPV